MILNEKQTKKLIPFAGGKGGTGTTTITANIALELAANEKDTVVIDLDLGGSNLHTALGVKNTNRGIGNFLTSPEVDFQSIIAPTPFERLRLIPGDVLVPGLEQADPGRVGELYDAITALDADYLLLDVGSGSGANLDSFLLSDSGLVVMDSSKTSVLNTYRFFKNLVYRILRIAFSGNTGAADLLEGAFRGKDPGSFTRMGAVLKEMEDLDGSAAGEARKQLATLQPKLILNDARTPDELDTVQKLAGLVRRDFEIEVECMGLIYHDDAMDEALELGEPFMLVGGVDAMAAREIARIAQKILQSERFPVMPLDLEYYKDSFELARIESAADYQELQDQDLAAEKEQGLTHEDLVGVIQEQQKKIQELKSTVRMLTLRRGNQ